MSRDRRQFLKFLSALPLATAGVISGCKSSTDSVNPDLVSAPDSTVDDSTVDESPAPSVAAPPKSKPISYSNDEDLARMKKVEGYGVGLPENPQCPLTGPDVLGPFHRKNAPSRVVLAGKEEPGERIKVTGRVLLHDCKTPVKGAVIDLWHADVEGRYDNDSSDFRLRGQVTTDDKGVYTFETIKPGFYPLGRTMRPAHIHFNVSYPGCHPLTTQLYFKGDKYLSPNDPCGVCSSGNPTLIVPFEKQGEGAAAVLAGTFDIILAKG